MSVHPFFKPNFDRRLARDQYGFSTLTILIVLGVASAAVGAAALQRSLNSYRSPILSSAELHLTADLLRYNLTEQFRNQESLRNTLQDPRNLNFKNCYDKNVDCPTAPQAINVVLNASGSTIFDNTKINEGFDLLGNPCSSYPSQSCIFQLQLKWQKTTVGCAPLLNLNLAFHPDGLAHFPINLTGAATMEIR